jgi:hypothetical protein
MIDHDVDDLDKPLFNIERFFRCLSVKKEKGKEKMISKFLLK